jgi:hypothetical protein
MHLTDPSFLAEQPTNERKFLRQALDILHRPGVVARNDLVERAKAAAGIAGRQVHVHRERLVDTADIAGREPMPTVGLAECFNETVRRRVRR